MSNAATTPATPIDLTPGPSLQFPRPARVPSDAAFLQAIADHLPGEFGEFETAALIEDARRYVAEGCGVESAVEEAFLAGRWA